MNRIGEGSQDHWPEKILHEFHSKTTIFGLHFHSHSQLVYACDDPTRYVIEVHHYLRFTGVEHRLPEDVRL